MRVEIYRSDHDGLWYWRKKAGNNEIVATGEGYTRREDARIGALNANQDIDEAQVVDIPSDYSTEVDG